MKSDPIANRTYHYWHTFVGGVGPGQVYGYRDHGPCDPGRGRRFDPAKVLRDPYGRAVVSSAGRTAEAMRNGDVATALRNAVLDPSQYD